MLFASNANVSGSNCTSFNFVVFAILLVLVLGYMSWFICYTIKNEIADHDTISSSMYNADDPKKRAFLMCLGFLSFLLISLYLDEHGSRTGKGSTKVGWTILYAIEIASFVGFGFIGVLPGGEAFRKFYRKPSISKSEQSCYEILDICHTAVAAGSLAVANLTISFYCFMTRKSWLSYTIGLLSLASLLSAIVFASMSNYHIRNFHKRLQQKLDGHGYRLLLQEENQANVDNNANIPLENRINNNNVENNQNNNVRIEQTEEQKAIKEVLSEMSAEFNQWTYITESISFGLCIVCLIVTTMIRNDNFPCLQEQ